MPRHAIQLTTIALSAAVSIEVLLFTGLVDGVNWYSSESAYRRQSASLCHGQLALSADPRDVSWDMVWHDGEVHQVWGLGVPLLRLPFDLLARTIGVGHFPDRLTFGLAILLVSYATCCILLPLSRIRSLRDLFSNHLCAVLSVGLLILFPPFLTLCRTRFLAYEEAEAYSYLAGVLLLVLTISVSKSLTWKRIFTLAVVAGFAPFIRPTLLAYSIASMLVAVRRLQSSGHQWVKSAILLSPMPVLITALMITNFIRFGSPLEFGHSINLNSLDPMRYVSRFGSPFSDEPLKSAAVELFSCLFLTNNHLNGGDWYRRDFFPGQSETLRWREFYFTVFDWSYLVLILAGWIAGLWCSVKRRHLAHLPEFTVMHVCFLWSAIATIQISLFYIRFPSVSSRYNLDFAPAFCAATIACLYSLQIWTRHDLPRWRFTVHTVYLACFVWMAVCIGAASTTFPSIPPITAEQAVAEMISYHPPKKIVIPSEYKVGMELSSDSLPFNATGWDLQCGATKAALALWIDDPQYLELTVTGATEGVDIDPRVILAKIGLEHLTLISLQNFGPRTVLRFQGPTGSTYRHGLQVAYIGMVGKKNVSESDSLFKLLRVRWREESSLSEAK